MNFTAKVTTVWTGHTDRVWEAARDLVIDKMITEGKTDGVLVVEPDDANGDSVFYRNFIDQAAAQEFVDWWNASEAASVATISITDI